MRIIFQHAGSTLFICCLLAWLAVSPAAAQQNPICGDCNMDNRVTSGDTVLALQAANGTAPVPVDDRCDVDQSGGPTASDGLLIAQFTAGLLPTLTCSGQTTLFPVAVPPNPVLDPFSGAFGNCVQGQSRGNGWTFSIFGNPGQQSGTAPAVPNTSTATTLAAAWVNAINNSTTITNYMAIPYAGNCFIVLDNVNFNQAFVQITSGGPACAPDLTGTPCPFG